MSRPRARKNENAGAYVDPSAVHHRLTRSAVLPAAVECPLCRGRMTVYQDTTHGGGWHHCTSCKFAGDTLELAACVFGTALALVPERLRAAGEPIPAEATSPAKWAAYVRNVERRTAINNLWKTSQTTCLHDLGRAAALLHKIGVGDLVPASQQGWQRGFGQLAGLSTKTELQAVMSSGPHAHTRWNEALILPYHDLPGRIAGFWGIPDKLFAPFFMSTVSDSDGIWLGGDELPEASQVWLVDDPTLYCWLQMRQLTVSLRPLPVVLWRDLDLGGTTGHCWQELAGRRVGFWPKEIDRITVHAAAAVDASIVEGLAALRERSTEVPAQSVISRFEAAAASWPLAIERRVLRFAKQYGPIRDWLAELRLSSDHIRRIRTKVTSPVLQRNLEALAPSHHAHRSVAFGNRRVIEQGGVWHMASESGRVSSLLSDVLVRLDTVMAQPTKGRTFYRGRVLQGDKEYPFFAPQEALRLMSRWLRTWLPLNGGTVPQLRPGADAALWTAMLQFSTTETVQVADKLGWCSDRRAFVFPRFELVQGGHRVLEPMLFEEKVLPGDQCELAKPAVKDWPQTAEAWAVARTVLENVTAAMRGVKPATWLICGLHSTPELVRAMGCLPKLPGDGQWPLVTEARLADAKTGAVTGRNAVLYTPVRPLEVSLMLRQAPRAFRLPDASRAVSGDFNACRTIVPSFVAWLLDHSERLSHQFERLLLSWLGDIGGPRDAALQAERLVDAGAGSTSEAFLRFLAWLCASGELEYVRHGFQAGGRRELIGDYVYGQHRGMLVMTAALRAAAWATKSPFLEMEALRQELTASGLMLAEVPERDAMLLDETAWRGAVRSFRTVGA